MINIKPNQQFDLLLLLKLANTCEGDVILASEAGDRLDLKSGLSQYVFTVLLHNMDPGKKYWIECSEEDEAALRQAFDRPAVTEAEQSGGAGRLSDESGSSAVSGILR